MPGVLVGFAGLVLFFYLFNSIPLPDAIGAQPTVIMDVTGQVQIGTLQPDASREDIALADLPPHVWQAVLAAEDDGYYEHGGVSLTGIFRAAYRNVVAGGVEEGGSTISQQYIKKVTQDEERSMLRKVREAVLAVKLERTYSKDQILQNYLNLIYFGRGAYGIQAAARAYFGVDAAQMTASEAAFVAGIIAAPSAYDPAVDPAAAVSRYSYVLDRMVVNGWMDAAEAARVAVAPPQIEPRKNLVYNSAPWFLDMVREELEGLVDKNIIGSVYDGLTVRTTLDMGVQLHAETAFTDKFDDVEPQIGGALVAVDPATGGIRALVGGRSYADSQLNLAYPPRPSNGGVRGRQPGSTFKPFALAAYIAAGNSPESFFDAPGEWVVAGGGAGGSDYEVHNYESASYEPMSLRTATQKSVNTVYAQVMEEVGPQAIVDMARSAGVTEAPLEAFSSVVLGTAEVTPLELAGAYNTFAAKGVFRTPHTIERIIDDTGLMRYQGTQQQRVAMSEAVAATVTDVLTGVISAGTGSAADIGRPAAGKTGTTQDYGDAWFAGYTPQLTAVVWMGNVENRDEMPGRPTGGDLPAELWGDFMDVVMQSLPLVEFPAPSTGLTVTRGSPAPTASEEASEPMSCPDGQVALGPTPDGSAVDEASDDPTSAPVCVEVSPSASPSESVSPSASPSPTASGGDPDVSPSPEPTKTSTASPSPGTDPSAEPTDEPTGGQTAPDEPPAEDGEPSEGPTAGPTADPGAPQPEPTTPVVVPQPTATADSQAAGGSGGSGGDGVEDGA